MLFYRIHPNDDISHLSLFKEVNFNETLTQTYLNEKSNIAWIQSINKPRIHIWNTECKYEWK